MKLFSKLSRARPRATIRLLDDGFAVDRDEVEIFRVRWEEVLEIVTFKRDLLTTDCVCLAFRCSERNVYSEVNEEIPGFAQLIDELPYRFAAIDSEWFNKVTQPPFATSFTRLHGSAP